MRRKTTINDTSTDQLLRYYTRKDMGLAKKRKKEWNHHKRKTKYLLIASQTNGIRRNYIKAKIYNTQQNVVFMYK